MTSESMTSEQGHYFNRYGEPVTLEEWSQLMQAGNRQVAQHWVRTWRVSTIWLGLDMSWHFESGVPLIFETMIFAPPGWPEGEGLDLSQWRWPTEEVAINGHWEKIRALQAELGAETESVLARAPFLCQPLLPARRQSREEEWERRDAMRWRPG